MLIQRHNIPMMRQKAVRYRGEAVTHDHIENFYNLMKYFVRLRREGDIDNETFEELVRQATASFVQTEVSERIDQVLEGKLSLDYFLELM